MDLVAPSTVPGRSKCTENCAKSRKDSEKKKKERNKRNDPEPQMVKNLPVMQETEVQSLSQDDPLEKGIASRSSILAWRIPWTEESGRLHSP